MAIPNSQLQTWAAQGSVTQSASTYNTIKDKLEEAGSPYATQDSRVFLQGSYGNSTNIYRESDVDVVICLTSAFQHNTAGLTPVQKAAFDAAYQNATYTLDQFKTDVHAHLVAAYGNDVYLGKKAIQIRATTSRRKTDVIVAMEHRHYFSFLTLASQSHGDGIVFKNSAGKRIINYPEYHRANLVTKNTNAGGRFKSYVRIFKNMRVRAVSEGFLAEGNAPSYYIEGLLYNLPDNYFVADYATGVNAILNFLATADRSAFTCANGFHILHGDDPDLQWTKLKGDQFILALRVLWNTWA